MAGFGSQITSGVSTGVHRDVKEHIHRFFRAQLTIPGVCAISSRGGLGKTTLSTSICAFWEEVSDDLVFPFTLIAKRHIDRRLTAIFSGRFLTVALQNAFLTFLDDCSGDKPTLTNKLQIIHELIASMISDLEEKVLFRALLLTFRESSDSIKGLNDFVSGVPNSKVDMSVLSQNSDLTLEFLINTGNFERFIIEIIDTPDLAERSDRLLFLLIPAVCGDLQQLFGVVSHLRSEMTSAAPGLQMATPVANADLYNFFDPRSGSGCVLHGRPSTMLGFASLFSCVRVSTVGEPHTTHIVNGETLKGGLSAKIPAIIQEYNDSSVEIGARVVIETRDEYSITSGTEDQIKESMARLASSSRLSLISMDLGVWTLRVRDYFSTYEDSDIINIIGHADGFVELKLRQCFHFPGPSIEPGASAKLLRHKWPSHATNLVDGTYNMTKKAFKDSNGGLISRLLIDEI